MKILIDLQASQTASSRQRGVGRYAQSLVTALIDQDIANEYCIATNSAFSEASFEIRSYFAERSSAVSFFSFDILPGSAGKYDSLRQKASELIRERQFSSQDPNVILTTSLFEGYHEDAVTSIGSLSSSITQAVILYDLIPLVGKETYLQDRRVRDWYYRKLQSLRRADVILAISEFSRCEAIETLRISPEKIFNISSAADSIFKNKEVSNERAHLINLKYEINSRFVLYTGGIDPRKNIEGLIEAFSLLPSHVLGSYQLVIVCSISDSDRRRLLDLASIHSIPKSSIRLTGYVPEDDLVTLYNMCDLFVFPSLHEGFGLPALEAMQCGAPVIGSGGSSLKEVIAEPEAMFDPRNIMQICTKMTLGLTDNLFRNRLVQNSMVQSKKYSWAMSAAKTIEILVNCSPKIQSKNSSNYNRALAPRLRLAIVSPVPPLETGIANYTSDLLPFLSKYYNINIVTDQDNVESSWIVANSTLVSTEWFSKNYDTYDRVLYHIGNSDFHSHMPDLLKVAPGVVVLHDFYLSGMVAWQEYHHGRKNFFTNQLLDCHGIGALQNHFTGEENAAIWAYPVNHPVLESAGGLIVHSKYSKSLILEQKWFGVAPDVTVIPHLKSKKHKNRAHARQTLHLKESEVLICTFGVIGETKCNIELIKAFSQLPKFSFALQLVFVGGGGAAYETEILQLIKTLNIMSEIRITGYASDEMYNNYLEAADIAVQLRRRSRGETSGTVLDCMAYGVPVIVNKHGTMEELSDGSVEQISDDFCIDELVESLTKLISHANLRETLVTTAFSELEKHHNPLRIAKSYFEAIENSYIENPNLINDLVLKQIIYETRASSERNAIRSDCQKILNINTRAWRKKRFLIDTTVISAQNNKTGIQRVIENLVPELLKSGIDEYQVNFCRIDPTSPTVIWTDHKFSHVFFGVNVFQVEEHTIEMTDGDIYLGLDLNPLGIVAGGGSSLFDVLKTRGVKIYFVVYDLLPLMIPHRFQSGAFPTMNKWIETISSVSDGILTISKRVSKDLRLWMDTIEIRRTGGLKIGHFPLGVSENFGASGTLVLQDTLLEALGLRRTFLAVGTIEPRKGFEFILSAFEILLSEGADLNLIISGKQGWLSDDFCRRLVSHAEYDRRIFWVAGGGDIDLAYLYSNTICLLSLSEAEGFGLPIIEAQHFGLPVIARDLPVFRELQTEGTSYFSGYKPEELASFISKWLKDFCSSTPLNFAVKHPWQRSAEVLLERIINDNWDETWLPKKGIRYRSSDEIFICGVGYKNDGLIIAEGSPGLLFQTESLQMTSGSYAMSIFCGVGDKGFEAVRVFVNVDGRELFSCSVDVEMQKFQEIDVLNRYEFHLKENTSRFSIGIIVGVNTDLAFSRLEITPI